VSCRLATFHKAPGDKIGDYVLDANDSATMQVVLGNGALGTVAATRFASGHLNDLRLRLYGDKGGLEVSWEKNVSRLRACLAADMQTGDWHDIDAPVLATIYERFIAAIRGEGVADPDFARGAALQRMLDRAEQSAAQGGLSLKV
jgi:predicted dehydrogenase